MTYTWFLFDADGTLFNYDAAERKALSATFAEFDLAFAPVILQTYREVNGKMWSDFELGRTTAARIKTERFARLFAVLRDAGCVFPATPDSIEFSNRYLANLGACTQLMPGAEAVLEALRPRVRLALITNGLTTVQRSRFSRSGFDSIFEAIVISDEEGVSKPDPRIFQIVFDRMGNPGKGEVLMVGDSLTSDIRGANAYGIDACWYNPEGKPPQPDVTFKYEISRLPDLLDLCCGDGSGRDLTSG